MLGKLEPLAPHIAPRLVLNPHFAGSGWPTVTSSVNYTTGLTSIGMYDNTTYNDCVTACMAHVIEAWTLNAAGAQYTPSDANVLAAYRQITGWTSLSGVGSPGMAIQQGLNYWQTFGIDGHKISGFGQIVPTTPSDTINMVNQALKLFGAVIVGFNLTSNVTAVMNPWVVPSAPYTTQGGHCVPILGMTYNGNTANTYTIATWGGLVTVPQAYITTFADEFWVPLSTDWINSGTGLSPSSLSLSSLISDFHTGNSITQAVSGTKVLDIETSEPVTIAAGNAIALNFENEVTDLYNMNLANGLRFIPYVDGTNVQHNFTVNISVTLSGTPGSGAYFQIGQYHRVTDAFLGYGGQTALVTSGTTTTATFTATMSNNFRYSVDLYNSSGSSITLNSAFLKLTT